MSSEHLPDELTSQFMYELLDLHTQVKVSVNQTHRNQNVAGVSVPVSPDATANQRTQKHRKNFEDMWNYPGIGHFCTRVGENKDAWCCQSDEHARDKLADSLLQLALGSVPETPAPGKWTKLWPCLQFPDLT